MHNSRVRRGKSGAWTTLFLKFCIKFSFKKSLAIYYYLPLEIVEEKACSPSVGHVQSFFTGPKFELREVIRKFFFCLLFFFQPNSGFKPKTLSFVFLLLVCSQTPHINAAQPSLLGARKHLRPFAIAGHLIFVFPFALYLFTAS